MDATRLNGPKVRAIREILQISRAELADGVDIAASYLSHIETGLKQPSPAIARRIVDWLLVAVDQGLIAYGITDDSGEAVA
jgi:transcriptional regulator with XRE-family HTH domain